jgi:hypothetical protein
VSLALVLATGLNEVRAAIKPLLKMATNAPDDDEILGRYRPVVRPEM